MGLSFRESLATTFAGLAMIGIMAGVPAPDANDQAQMQNPLSEISYCDAECNANLGGVSKMVKAFLDADRKRHGKHDYANVIVYDDPVVDGLEHYAYLPLDKDAIVEMVEPPEPV